MYIETFVTSTSRPEMKAYLSENCNTILDIGCNDGQFASSLMQAGREVWGLEINPQQAEIAASKITKIIVGDFDEVYDSLPKSYFDCIYFNDVLEHMLFPWDVLAKVKHLLKSEGIVVSSLPNFRYVGNLQEIIFKRDFQYKSWGILYTTHFRFFTMKSIFRMYQNSGYDVVINEGIRPSNSWKLKLFSYLSLGFFSDIKYMQIATVAKHKK